MEKFLCGNESGQSFVTRRQCIFDSFGIEIMAASGVKSEKKSAARTPIKKSSATTMAKANVAMPPTAISKSNSSTASRGRISNQLTAAKAEVPTKIRATVAKTPTHKAAAHANEPQSRSNLSNNKTDDKIADKIH